MLWGPTGFVSESRFLAFEPAEKNLDLHEGNKFSQVAQKEDAVVCWPPKSLLFPLVVQSLSRV